MRFNGRSLIACAVSIPLLSGCLVTRGSLEKVKTQQAAERAALKQANEQALAAEAAARTSAGFAAVSDCPDR